LSLQCFSADCGEKSKKVLRFFPHFAFASPPFVAFFTEYFQKFNYLEKKTKPNLVLT